MKRFTTVLCVTLVMATGGPVWGGGEGEEESFKETIRAMQERIKQLEGEVQQLKGAPPGAVVAAPSNSYDDRIKKLEDGLGLLGGLKFGGMIYSSYNYNYNSPDSHNNDLRIFDNKANNFTFDLAQLSVSKEEEGGVGFKLLLDYGRTARGIASDWNGDGSFSNGTDNFEVQEAYITYTAGIGRGLGLKAGKFVTLLGQEVIEAPNNFNISRSFLFGFAIPFTHTGMLLSYPFLDSVSLSAGIVNGWDNVIDSNKGKTFLGGLTWKPLDALTWTFNGTFGPEQPNRGGSKRGVFDTVLSYNWNDNITLAANYDHGSESDIASDGGTARWQGVAGYVSIGGALFHPDLASFSLSQRIEWFSDEDGVRTGTAQDLWEATTTLKWKITDHLQARFEFRHDDSSKKVFSKQIYRRGDESITQFIGHQNTVAAELAYLFY
jgi:Putative beta-barrel porin-2, OmpL-like. bbp2